MRDRPQGWPVPPAAQPATQLAAAHATFVGVIAASTALQRPLGLTTATRLLGLRVAPALCGLAAVGGASVAAVRAASAVADRAAGDDAAAWRRRRARAPSRAVRGGRRALRGRRRPLLGGEPVVPHLARRVRAAGARLAAGDAGVRLEIGARRDPGARPPLRLPLVRQVGAHELRRRPHAAALGGARRQPRAVAPPPPAARGAALLPSVHVVLGPPVGRRRRREAPAARCPPRSAPCSTRPRCARPRRTPASRSSPRCSPPRPGAAPPPWRCRPPTTRAPPPRGCRAASWGGWNPTIDHFLILRSPHTHTSSI